MIRKAVSVGVVIAAALAAGDANATISFTFDNTAYANVFNSGSTPTTTNLQTYMTNAYAAQGGVGSVTITGAGVLSDNNYTGDGHVVGPISGGTVTPLTLGSTNAGVQHPIPPATGATHDNYIVNNPPGSNTTFQIHFSSLIFGVSFDYEIFPDGSCPNPGSSNSSVNLGCTSKSNSNWPDFKFYVNSVSTANLVLDTQGNVPVSGFSTVCHGAGSPATCGPGGTEPAPQYLSSTVSYTFVNGVNDLFFVDWPATVGIDNLVVDNKRPPQKIPEPASLGLFGLALVGLAAVRRRRKS
jgi:hypothetical protein